MTITSESKVPDIRADVRIDPAFGDSFTFRNHGALFGIRIIGNTFITTWDDHTEVYTTGGGDREILDGNQPNSTGNHNGNRFRHLPHQT